MSAFVKAQRTDHRVPVATSCRALGLSQSWFYKHVDRKPTAREIQRQELDEAIESAFHANDGEYGSPRIHAELLDHPRWQSLSVNTVARRMAARSLCAAHKRRRKCTTRADSSVQHAPNLLARDFDPPAPNIAWAGDITQVNTWQGPIFTATVIDLFSRRLIGFSVAESANAGLVTDALKMALATRGGGACGVIMHTDRGSQGGFNRSSQHLIDGGDRWADRSSSWWTLRPERGGSGRQTGRSERQCAHQGGRSRHGRCSVSSGG